MSGDSVERGEPISALWHLPHECRARWRNSAGAGWAVAYIRVGTLDDGRWFIDTAGPDAGTTAWPNKLSAWREVQRLMALREGPWEQVPCYPTQEQRGG